MVFEFMEFQGDHFFDGLQKKKIKSKANGKAKRPVAAAKKSKAKAGAKGKPKAKLAARGGKRR
jgi:hypothetical protein